jgi:hypothetical protein
MRPAWVTRAITQLVRQFCSRFGNSAWIGIASLDPFAGRGPGPRAPLRDSGHYEAMPGLSSTEGVVWRPAGPPDDPELWLAPTLKGYRAVFERFAMRYLNASGLAAADVQIDHVFPKKAGALGGLSHVRMLAIPPESNMAAGRTLERAMVARIEDLGPPGKPVRMATYFAVGKATGFTGYEQLPDDEDSLPNQDLARALIAHLRSFGLPADVLTALDQKLTAERLSSFR